MWKLLKNAWRVDEVRKKLIFTFLMLIVIRLGSTIPIPGVNAYYFEFLFSAIGGLDGFGWFNAMTGGSFSQLSVFALSISPYITSSIIIQLLTIAIPALEEIQKDGETGRKKIAEYTRYMTVALALIESAAMAIGFGGQGLLYDYNVGSIIVCVITMTAGTAILMWIGEQITDKGIGNGISMVLLFNILSSLPTDVSTLYYSFISGKSVPMIVLALVIILVAVIALIVYTIVLNDATRNIPVQYSRKMQGRRLVGGQNSNIPLKVNTAGVIPVIFASSIMSMPVVVGSFLGVSGTSTAGRILSILSSNNWCNPRDLFPTIGLLIYIALVVLFAYFYTSITFNPLEIANNMKKNGGFIPGVRPGKPTSDYLSHILNYVIFIGAIGLLIACVTPMIVTGVFGMGHLSFTGTSLIIIVSVIVETIKSIESQLLVRNYKGFLND
ncbi:MAG TPA: preprotein translocase subunit SecY [Candidatus Avilachnospira avistercoris]|nr:preprotein translocase subunit SecY [Candidatus Avilachnospira avistercoris]